MHAKGNELIHNESYDIYYKNSFFKVNKKTNKYIDMPIKYYPNSIKEDHLEYHTGCYNYLYSKSNYRELTSFVSLKDTIFNLSNNDTSYNGYVLFNHEITDQIDVGLSIRYINDSVIVQPFYYYMGGLSDKVFYLDSMILSTFIKKDNYYIGRDTFKIILKATHNGWYFKINVLDSSLYYEKEVVIKEKMHQLLDGRFLVGVSLVPIKDDLFNPLSGAMLKDVFIDYILLDEKDYLFPGSNAMLKGYSQGYPFADVKVKKNSFICSTIYK